MSFHYHIIWAIHVCVLQFVKKNYVYFKQTHNQKLENNQHLVGWDGEPYRSLVMRIWFEHLRVTNLGVWVNKG